LKNNIDDAKKISCSSSATALKAPWGDQILKGKSPVNIFGDPYDVHAKIVRLDTYSGHADRNEIEALCRKNSPGTSNGSSASTARSRNVSPHAVTLHAMKPDAQVIVAGIFAGGGDLKRLSQAGKILFEAIPFPDDYR